MRIDWYERRNELESGQVFRTVNDYVVKLDRGVPGDGTRWYVLDWQKSPYDNRWYWSCDDSTIEPGDLTDRLADDWKG